MGSDRLVKGSERLTDPITAGSVHFLQQFFGMLPRPIQRRVLEGASRTTPYMGFVVEPYATFLLFEIADVERAARLLPDGFRLVPTCAFSGEQPAYYAVLGFFRVRTSTFIGARAEFNLIAEDERSGLLTWVIVDYLSDTVSYDRAHGLRGPSAAGAVVTTTADGRVMVDLRADTDGRGVAFDVSLAAATTRALDERLWVEGNLSVAYGPALSPDDAGLFSLTFAPEEMAEALELSAEGLRMTRMAWYDDLLVETPSQVVCFPFAQHLLSDSPGAASRYRSVDELQQVLSTLDMDAIPTFSMASTRRGIVAGTLLSLAVMASLLLALVVT